MDNKVISKDELFLSESLLYPVSFFNYFMPQLDRNISISRDYQDKILLSSQIGNTVVARTGRAIGKTSALNSMVANTILANPLKEGLITTPMKAHIDPIFNKLISFLESNKLFKHLIDVKNGARVLRSPEYYIELTNGFRLYGRIAGTNRGSSLFGLHVDFIWVDEAGHYLDEAVDNLQGCMNKNCTIVVFGVPFGLRNSYLTKLWDDSVIPSFCKHKISRYMDPSFTPIEEKRLEKIYGGKNSVSFLNQVMAEDDVAQKVTFNPQYYTKCFEVFDSYQTDIIDGKRFDENTINEDIDLRLPVAPDGCVIYTSADVGYDPDPTVFGVFAKGMDGISTLIYKLVLRSITYTRQTQIMNYINTKLESRSLSVDVGGPGRTIYLDLMNEKLFPDREYFVFDVKFGGSVTIGIDKNNKEIKAAVKYHSTILLDRLFQTRKILLPENDVELYTEVYTSTQYKTQDGNYKYNGIDHNLDMLRAYALTGLYIENLNAFDMEDIENTNSNSSGMAVMIDI